MLLLLLTWQLPQARDSSGVFQMSDERTTFLAGVLGALGARGGAESAVKALVGDRAVDKFLNEAGCGRTCVCEWLVSCC